MTSISRIKSKSQLNGRVDPTGELVQKSSCCGPSLVEVQDQNLASQFEQVTSDVHRTQITNKAQALHPKPKL